MNDCQSILTGVRRDVQGVLQQDPVVGHDVERVVGPLLLTVEHVVLGADQPSAGGGENNSQPT